MCRYFGVIYSFLQKMVGICSIVLREQSYTGIWAFESFILYASFISLQ